MFQNILNSINKFTMYMYTFCLDSRQQETPRNLYHTIQCCRHSVWGLPALLGISDSSVHVHTFYTLQINMSTFQ